MVDGLDWSLPTPAEGWTVRDTVLHLHATDLMGLAATTGGDLLEAFVGGGRAARDLAYPGELADRWRTTRSALVDAVLAWPADAGKLPWVGPPMSPASFLTARLMETWAHGVDIRDAANLPTSFSPRLRHVADLGVRTRGWSYANRGLPVPTAPVHVALTTPDAEVWEWGPPAAQAGSGTDPVQRVSGPALDFCLLVVQRRPRTGLALVADGPDADRWLDIAQAYAGPPTDNAR